MGAEISGLHAHTLMQPKAETVQTDHPAAGRRSFASLIQEPTRGSGEQEGTAKEASSQVTGSGDVSSTSGSQLEQHRLELMKQLSQMPTDESLNKVIPELMNDSSRSRLLREAMKGLGYETDANRLSERFGQVESEWYQIERIMKSDDKLSPGELLGLQARLYQVTQHVELISRVVDQMNNGVKTILNTNV